MKPAYNEISRHQMFLRCRPVPFHAPNWRLDSRGCKGFPLKTGFHWAQVQFETYFSEICCFQGCYWGLVYSVYEKWCSRRGDFGGFTFSAILREVEIIRAQQFAQYQHSNTFLPDHTTAARNLNSPETSVPAAGGGALMQSEERQSGQEMCIQNKRNDFLLPSFYRFRYLFS